MHWPACQGKLVFLLLRKLLAAQEHHQKLGYLRFKIGLIDTVHHHYQQREAPKLEIWRSGKCCSRKCRVTSKAGQTKIETQDEERKSFFKRTRIGFFWKTKKVDRKKATWARWLSRKWTNPLSLRFESRFPASFHFKSLFRNCSSNFMGLINIF